MAYLKALLHQRVPVRHYPHVIKTTGAPTGFLELPIGYFIYMLVSNGKIIFISEGNDPWEVASKLKIKYRADRILYQQIAFEDADRIVTALIDKYNPPYNSRTRSAKLSELDAILGHSDARAT